MSGTMRGLSLLLMLTAGCGSQPRQDPVTVLSFNIRYGSADDGADRWELRRELTLNTLQSAAADIIGIQEALAFQVDEVADALPDHSRVGVGRDDGVRAGEFVPIFYRTARFREEGHGHFWYSDTPDVPGSADWGNSITRMCTWVELVDRDTGLVITVFNTHWDHQSQPSREASANLLAERISRGNGSSVVTGDFNAGPSNPAIVALTGGPRADMAATPPLATGTPPLSDSYFMVNQPGPGLGTFHGFRGTTDGEKIDAILVGPGWAVDSATIDRTSELGRYPSDHFAVRAVLRYDR